LMTIPRPTDDENPRAYVVLAPKKPASKPVTEADIIAFVNTRVSKIKHLTGGCVFTDAIPKNPVSANDIVLKDVLTFVKSGKILRRQLREQAAKEGELTAKL
jgi:acyl-CoA synthetase (AMP-forming)/AMP-acid ligase II